MSRECLYAAAALVVSSSVACANVPRPASFDSLISAVDAGGSDGRSSAEPELALPQPLRRRRLKLHFADLADWLPWGVLVVDDQLQVLYASRSAMVALASGAGLSCRKGLLCTERASVDRALRDLVRLVLSRESGWNEEADVIGVPDRYGQLRYALRVISSGETLTNDVAVIAIADLSFRSKVRRDAVGRLFCLSEREAELAELFALGCRVQEIALQMRVAVNTARVHLRSVFQKTGCSSQVELARKFASLP